MTFPWSSPVVLAPLLSGVLVVALFCFWECKGARLPIVPSTFQSCHTNVGWLLIRATVYIFKQVTVIGVYITMFVK